VACNTLIVGCGYVGLALGRALIAEGHKVWGLRRRPASVAVCGLVELVGDVTRPCSLNCIPENIDLLVYAVSADRFDDDSYLQAYVTGVKNIFMVLQARHIRPRLLLFLSSISVYAQEHGHWVNEESETNPQHFSGLRILEGENLFRSSDFPTTILRLGYIYGPGRDGIVSRPWQYQDSDDDRFHYNFVHKMDCVEIAKVLLMSPSVPRGVYLGVDNEPVPRSQVVEWLNAQGSLFDRPLDKRAPFKARRGNKRCSNLKLRTLGYRFVYPTFKKGFSEIIQSICAENAGEIVE
jgi:nucleoside-diphosphate-sugar epimerase